MNGPKIHISKDSALVIEGASIELRSLDLDGAMSVRASGGARLVVDGAKERNRGWRWQALEPNEPMSEEQYIR